MTLNPRYWFQKRTSSFGAAATETQNRMRYNALFALDPDVMVRHLSAFAAGDIAGLERVIDEFETRDDKMRVGAFKLSAAVAAKPWEIKIAKGEESNPLATRHRDVLTRFWNRIEATDAFCRNRRGGLRTLVKQMMTAQSHVYACHDITWHVRDDGELEALFTFVPAWMFENRTGELRFLRDPGAYTGEPMNDGEWLVTVGEGVGIAASVLAMAKRLSWNDWLLFSEKCGMPVILGQTNAKEDSPAWNALLRAIHAVAPKTGILSDNESRMQAVQIGGSSGQSTYHELIETVDRAISALYRGGDLATMSSTQGEGTGSYAQNGESEIMDSDGCALISETLHRQIDRLVIRFTCGDFEPLAGIVINPPVESDDLDRDMKIDQHLGEFGVKLSKKDMLSRYGRTEATDENDAAIRQPTQQPGLQGGLNAFANERRRYPDARPFEGERSADLLAAFAKDTTAAGKAVAELLQDPTPEAAKALVSRLPSLLPDDPAMAAILAEAMAEEFGVMLANTEQIPAGHANAGQFTGKTNQPRGKEPETKPQHDRYGSTDEQKLESVPQKNIERGNAAIDEVMRKKSGYVDNAMFRSETGWLRIDWGDPGDPNNDYKGGHGLSHITTKHKGETAHLSETIAKGECYRHPTDPTKTYFVHEDRIVVVASLHKGAKKTITGYETERAKDIEEIKKYPRAQAPGSKGR